MSAVTRRVWREVDQIPPPEPIFAAPADELELAPKPAPPGVRSAGSPVLWWSAAGLVAVVTAAMAPQLLWVVVVVAAALGSWQLVHGRPRRRELKARRASLLAATADYAALLAEADRLGPPGFEAVKAHVQRLAGEYEIELPAREKAVLAEFRRSDEQRQLHRHLEGISVQNAAVVGLGPARKATLLQNGIISAARVSYDRIQPLPGFGPALTAALLTWREFCVRTFRYNDRDPVTARERDRALQPYAARRREIEHEIARAAQELHRLSSLSGEQRGELAQRLAAASRALAQAQLDAASL